jgi:predicted negative regulator of RcsB-dependent stress response
MHQPMIRWNPTPSLRASLTERGGLYTHVIAGLVLVTGCSAAPQPRSAPPAGAAHVGRATPPADMMPAGAPHPATQHSRLLEESDVGEAAVLTPPTTPAVASVPTPAPVPGQLAALPPPAAESAAGTPPSSDSDSLLARIGPSTPPNVAAALRLIEDGRQEMKNQNYNKALDRFERALTIDPTNAYGYYYLAQLHFLQKDYDQALAFAGRAAVLSAHTDPMWLGRVYALQGAVFEAVGRFPDARNSYRQAIAVDPNNTAARVGMARLSPQ